MNLYGMWSIFLATVSLGAGTVQDTPEARRTVAETYITPVLYRQIADSIVDEMTDALVEQGFQRDRLKNFFAQHTDWEQLRLATITAMVDVFTLEEIQALASFYGSETGRSVMSKMGHFSRSLMPSLQKELEKTLYFLAAEQGAEPDWEPAGP